MLVTATLVTVLRRLKQVRYISWVISDAAHAAFDAYLEGRVEEEPQITDRILATIEDRIRKLPAGAYATEQLADTLRLSHALSDKVGDRTFNVSSSPIVWKARTLRTGRGIAAEEKRHGADLLGVLDLNLLDYRAKKGFLARAKRSEPGQSFSKQEWKRLQTQCETMLLRTPESYVWAYSKSSGIRIFSANAILALKSRAIFDLYSRSMSTFFAAHIESFVGDRRLNCTKIETLDSLDELPVATTLELSASEGD